MNDESFQTEYEELKSEFKRVQFYKKHFNIICPQPVKLGSHLKKSNGTLKRNRDVYCQKKLRMKSVMDYLSTPRGCFNGHIPADRRMEYLEKKSRRT